jgi:replicative DNA helicase
VTELSRERVAEIRDATAKPSRQMPPVGPPVDAETLLIGALLWSDTYTADVLALVDDDDLSNPHAATILRVIRDMAAGRATCSPQLVIDQLTRQGLCRSCATLLNAVTSGAGAGLVREYAAAVVAASLRRRIESAGTALTAAAAEMAEADLAVLVANISDACTGAAHRLARLRGGDR